MQRGWPLRLLWLASHDRSTNYCDDDGCTDYHNASHYRSTNYGDDDGCSDYHNVSHYRSTNYCDYHIAKLWKLQRRLGSVWWQELDGPHLLRPGKYVQVFEPVVFSVHPAVNAMMLPSHLRREIDRACGSRMQRCKFLITVTTSSCTRSRLDSHGVLPRFRYGRHH